MKIEWDKIITNAISSLVTMAFIGAALIVWKGATTVDTKVTEATSSLKQTIDFVKESQKITQEELIKISSNQVEMAEKINSLLEQKMFFPAFTNVTIKPFNANIAVERSIERLDIQQRAPDYSRLPTIKYPTKD